MFHYCMHCVYSLKVVNYTELKVMKLYILKRMFEIH